MDWINVNDNLPDDFTSVIGFIRLNGDNDYCSGECYISSGIWHSVRNHESVKGITHWMPLPDAPKETSNGR